MVPVWWATMLNVGHCGVCRSVGTEGTLDSGECLGRLLLGVTGVVAAMQPNSGECTLLARARAIS